MGVIRIDIGGQEWEEPEDDDPNTGEIDHRRERIEDLLPEPELQIVPVEINRDNEMPPIPVVIPNPGTHEETEEESPLTPGRITWH